MQTRLSASPTPTLTLNDIVRKSQDLPSAPTVALAAMRHASEPDASAQTMARIIIQDQSLVLRVLRLANSSYYGFQREVTSVGDAVMMLGLKTIRNLALCASTHSWLSKPLDGYGLGPDQMWAHSLSVAVGAQVIAERSRFANPDIAFTAGILHDLGKTAINDWIVDKGEAMARLAELQHMTFCEVERKVLGFDHQQVGSYMARSWNLPKPLASVMMYHHCPLEAEDSKEMVCVIHLADYLSRALCLGVGADSTTYTFNEECMVTLKIEASHIDSIADEILTRYEDNEKIYATLAA